MWSGRLVASGRRPFGRRAIAAVEAVADHGDVTFELVGGLWKGEGLVDGSVGMSAVGFEGERAGLEEVGERSVGDFLPAGAWVVGGSFVEGEDVGVEMMAQRGGVGGIEGEF